MPQVGIVQSAQNTATLSLRGTRGLIVTTTDPTLVAVLASRSVLVPQQPPPHAPAQLQVFDTPLLTPTDDASVKSVTLSAGDSFAVYAHGKWKKPHAKAKDAYELLGPEVTWVSDDPTIAIVESGLIKAVKPGKVHVRASWDTAGRQCVGDRGSVMHAHLVVACALVAASGLGCKSEDVAAVTDGDATTDAAADILDAGDEEDTFIDAHMASSDVPDRTPECPANDYYIRMSGDISVELRHFSAFTPRYGHGNDYPSYVVMYRPDPHSSIAAAYSHDPMTDTHDINIDVENRQIKYWEEKFAIPYETKMGTATITLTRIDGVGGIVEGTFDGTLSRTDAAAPPPNSYHVTGEFRVCRLQDIHVE